LESFFLSKNFSTLNKGHNQTKTLFYVFNIEKKIIFFLKKKKKKETSSYRQKREGTAKTKI